MTPENETKTEKWVVARDSALHKLTCSYIAGVKDQLLGMAKYMIHQWTKRPCSELVAYYRTDGDIDVFTKTYTQLFPEIFQQENTE